MGFTTLKATTRRMRTAAKVGIASVVIITAWSTGNVEANPYYYNRYNWQETNINSGSTMALQISGSFTPTQNITNAYLITDQYSTYCASCTNTHHTSVLSLGNLQAGSTASFSYADGNLTNTQWLNNSEFTKYTIVGLYNNSSSAVVGIAGTVSGGWDDLFTTTENNLISVLNSNNPGAGLADFMINSENWIRRQNGNGYYSYYMPGVLNNNLLGDALTAYGFSEAIPLGTMLAREDQPNTPVPEPGTFILMLPALALGYMLRKRKKEEV